MSHPETILHHLARHADQQPEHTAFAFMRFGRGENEALTYGALYSRVLALAETLSRCSERGDRVLLLYPPGLDFIVGFFACLQSGRIAVPLYPPGAERRMSRLEAVADDARATTALTDNAHREDLARRFQDKAPNLQWPAESDAPPIWRPPADHAPDQIAFLQYTSGSTGIPKGVMVSHGNLIAASEDLHRGWNHNANSILVTWLPTFHDMGLVYGVVQPIFGGFPCVMTAPVSFLQKPVRWLEMISQTGATHTAAPNSAYDLCVRKITPEQTAGLNLSRWRVAVNGAEPIHRETLDRFSQTFAPRGFRAETFCPGYGLAEATLKVTATAHDQHPLFLQINRDAMGEGRIDTADADTTLVGCGVSHVGAQVQIVDPETHAGVGPDHIGEIWVAGPTVAAGYWDREIETEAVFRARRTDTGAGPFLRTGDLGFLRDGLLFVTGRLKDLIIIDGRNHFPGDIEHLVESHFHQVRTAATAAFAITRDDAEHAVLVCEIERRYLKSLDTQTLRDQIRTLILEALELPLAEIVFIQTGSIPKTTSGKIQRRACRDLWQADALKVLPESAMVDVVSYASNLHPLAARISPIVVRALDLVTADPDPHTPLVRFGLNSVSAAAIARDLSETFQRDLPAHLLYNHPTIHHLCRFLADEPVEEHGAARPARVGGGPIAVIGMGCRFPGAPTPAAFWDHLIAGRDMIQPPPEERFWFHEDRPGGYLEDVDHFDAAWFGISPAEAAWMDPQHRILMETARETLADGGRDPGTTHDALTGVFIGVSGRDYERLSAEVHAGPFVGSGLAAAMAANRLAHAFDLRGPCLTLDTACASGLSAVAQAVTALRLGLCDHALAGAVNLILDHRVTQNFETAGLISPTHHCHSFREEGDGYVRAEGCGVVLLQRLEDAVTAGAPIQGVIRGVGVSQNGRAAGLTAPHGPAMVAAMRTALADADLQPRDIDLLEAHATGTRLGDGIELDAVNQVYQEREQPLTLGALKACWGHMEAASGMAALIKVLLVLRFQKAPDNHHPGMPHHVLEQAAKLDFSPEPEERERHYAAVNSFGLGGVNVHLILERGHTSRPLPGIRYYAAATTAFWFPEPAAVTAMPATVSPYPGDGDHEVREAWVRGYLTTRLAAVLKVDASSLDVNRPLAQLGFESLMVMALKNRVEADLGVMIGAEHFYMAGDFQSLVDTLMEAMELNGEPDIPKNIEDMDVDNMSDDEVEAMLMQLMDDETG